MRLRVTHFCIRFSFLEMPHDSQKHRIRTGTCFMFALQNVLTKLCNLKHVFMPFKLWFSHLLTRRVIFAYPRVYPKVSGLAAWSENCKWYSSLPLGAVVSLFVSRSSEFCFHNTLCCFSTSVYCCCCCCRRRRRRRCCLFRFSPETFAYTLVSCSFLS
jgi:hypothetical protein